MSNNQINFIQAYNDPNSETYSNALQSGLVAGYSREYSENITHLNPKWLSESIGNNEFLSHALANLESFLKTKDDKWQSIKWEATKKVLDITEKRYERESELKRKSQDYGPKTEPLSEEERSRINELICNLIS